MLGSAPVLLAGTPLAAGGSTGGSGFLIIILVVLAVMFFMSQRSQRKRRKAVSDLQRTLLPGATVLTLSGMHATVVDVTDDLVRLEIAPGVVGTFEKRAVARVVTPDLSGPAVPTVEETPEPSTRD